MRAILIAVSLLVSTSLWGQFYSKIKEVEPYRGKLSRLDIYLQSNPDDVGVLYDELFGIAHQKKNKTLETVLQIYKGTGYYYSGQPDSALVYFDKAIALAKKIKNQKLLSTARIRRIFIIGESSDHTIAYQFMKDEFDIAKKHKDTLNMIYALNGMNLFGDHEENSGFDANMKAIRLARESGNEYEYGFLLNNLGVTKLDLGDSQGALKDLEKALLIARRAENTRLELTVMDNIGYYYMEVDSTQKARQMFDDVYNRASALKHHQLALTSMINLGTVYRAEGDLKRSDSMMNECLLMAKRTDMYFMVSLIYLNMAQIELMNENYSRVVNHLDSVQNYAKYTPNNDVQLGHLQIQYLMHKKKGDFEQALNFYRQWKDYQDSLDNNGRIQMITEMQLKYDVEREEAERLKQKNSYEKRLAVDAIEYEHLKQKIAIGIVILVILIAALVVYYFRAKQKRDSEFSQAIVNKLEEERGRIARDLHDGLGQSLIILKNKFNKIEVPSDPMTAEINENFTETIEEVRSISRSLIPPELRRLGLKKSLNKMLKDIERSVDIVVTTEIDDLDDIELDQASEIRLYRIIQELSNNTVKHSGASSLKLEILKTDLSISIIYQDNGIGITSDKLESTTDSVGIRSIEQRLKFMNGTVKFERPAKGFKAVIKIKQKK